MQIWGSEETKYFHNLSIDDILTSFESLDLKPTGRVIQLNSMENRVYEVEISLDHEPDSVSENFRIIKVYRPGRWSKEQILEEHQFIFDLCESEIEAIAPIKFNGQSLFENEQGLLFCIYPKKGGRAADEWTEPLLEQMGRLMARVHNIGATRKLQHRLSLDIETFGRNNLEYLLKSAYLPAEYRQSYESISNSIFQISENLFNNISYQRVHGDCHHGNTLINQNPFLIDFDDMLNGPCVQDLWMITPGRDEYSLRQRDILIRSYEQMRDFDRRELKLIESLRALRMIHFSSWIAHRFEDESFKRAFTNFASTSYWEKEIYDLKMQYSYIQEEIAEYY